MNPNIYKYQYIIYYMETKNKKNNNFNTGGLLK